MSRLYAACVAIGLGLCCVLPAGGAQAAQGSQSVVFVEMDAPSAGKVYLDALAHKADAAKATAAAQDHRAKIAAQQDALFRTVKGLAPGAALVYQVQHVLNGVAVAIPDDALPAIKGLPHVKAVRGLRIAYPTLETSIPFLGLPPLWGTANTTGLTGRGMRIGIIDTGINYVHPDFGGTGGLLEHLANSPSSISDVANYPGEKVVGGFDFAGENYDPDSPQFRVPVPDPDPVDLNGHGSHVAGIAAGMGVGLDDMPYRGPYNETLNMADLGLAPGVAPEAQLYALKVFGTNGGTQLVPQAVDWAVDPNRDGSYADHLDVINLSLSTPIGADEDTESQACNVAAQLGVIVCVAAGNDGNVFNILGTPAASTWAITVGATEDEDPGLEELGIELFPDRSAFFSSRGPTHSSARLLLKPDLAAPGVAINSANARGFTGNGLGALYTGTSMAAPHVAGIMALLRQQRPDWSVRQLKALAMNTAVWRQPDRDNVTVTRTVLPQNAGAGRIDPGAAATQYVIAFDLDNPAACSLTFQSTDVATTLSETRHIFIHNRDAAPHAFQARVEAADSIPGVAFTIAPAETGVLAPGASMQIDVTMHADASAMRRKRPADVAVNQLNQPRAWFSEAAGHIVFEPQGAGQQLHLPYYAAPRPVSDMHVETPGLDFSESDTASIALKGRPLDSGETEADERSLVLPVELLYRNDNPNPLVPAAARIKYVGVSTDYRSGGNQVSPSYIAFAIAGEDEWRTPHQLFYAVRVDTNGDGAAEFSVFNTSYWDPSSLQEFIISDAHISARTFANTFTQGFFSASPLNAVNPTLLDSRIFQSNVMVLACKAHNIGLRQAGPTEFDFWVESFFTAHAFNANTPDMKTPTMHFDLLHPGLDFSDGKTGVPVYYDKPGVTVPVKFNLQDYLADQAIGAALVHLHNAMPERVEIMYALTNGDSDRDDIVDKEDGAIDSDGDGIPNFLDDDSDDDGISDKVERNVDSDGDLLADFLDGDSDDDGLADKQEGMADSDRDGTADYLDLDSDGDGIADKVEEDGDPDGDGIANYVDADSDGDGLADALERSGDLDQDGEPNFLDLDSDGDEISDADEVNFYRTSPVAADTDEDGVDDGEELIAGRDPLLAQAPAVPQFAGASRGDYADRIVVTWLHVAGAVEYRIVRSATSDLDDAIPLGGWTADTILGDYTALAPQSVRGGGCSAPVPVPQIYTYWVKARNAGGESGYSQPITGFRGGNAAAR